MHIWELGLIALSLSMDAFAVSVCTGLSMGRATLKRAALVGLYFGGFQAAMPLLGYFLGSRLERRIEALDHWIAFLLLAVIGGKMIYEALQSDSDCPVPEPDLGPRRMLPLAVATSIDALAVGITFAVLHVDILPSAGLIGVVTFILSAVGVKAGHLCGSRLKSGAEMVGGGVLVLLGLKILIEHTLAA